jgi:DNA-binding transcriptional LysR family regulator
MEQSRRPGSPQPDLRQYRYFCTLARQLHFARAAEELGISQPALSQQIRLIEAMAGGPLLVRTSRALALTPLGQLLFDRAERLLEQADRVTRELASAARGETGHVAIGYVASASLSGVLPRIVYDYRRLRPGVEVSLRELEMTRQIDAISQEELDVGFIRPPIPDVPTGVAMFDLIEEPMCIVLHRDHPRARDSVVDVAALSEDTFICTHRNEGVGFYAITLAICSRAGFVPKTEVFSPQASVLISMVAAGFGVALVPVSTRAFAPVDVVFKPLADDSVRSKLAMAYSLRIRSPAVRHFVEAGQVWSRGKRAVGRLR